MSLNNTLREDPSRTLAIQNRWIRDFERRFKRLKAQIYQAVVTLDCFGLIQRTPVVLAEIAPRQFQFSRDDKKIEGFMSWLEDMEAKGLLEMEYRAGMFAGPEPWTNLYIRSTYQQSIAKARQELISQGYDIPEMGGVDLTGADPAALAFNQPFHAERVATIYTRAYNELKGVTAAMNQQISRVLAQGLMEGKGPREIARDMVDRVDNIGIVRARMIARTETVFAHHQATCNTYEQWGVKGVTVEVEFLTAGYNVCPVCARLSGKIFTIEEIRGMIPVHPNCRCAAIPVLPKTGAVGVYF